MIRLESVLKTSLQDVFKTSWRCLEDDFARRLVKTSWRCLEDVLKTSWRRLEERMTKTNILILIKTYWRRLLKTHDYSEYVRLDQDVLKTSWRRRWKTSSRRLYQDECLLGERPLGWPGSATTNLVLHRLRRKK